MKIVIVGLLSLILNSCTTPQPTLSTPLTESVKASVVAPALTEFKLNLSQIETETQLQKIQDGRYIFKNSDQLDLKIFSHQFANQNQVKSYMLNRRMLLHRSFQDEIAPYFGLIEGDKSCMEKANTKGEITKIDKNSEYLFLELPINKNKVLSDCHGEKIWGVTRYLFYNCKKTNALFELRLTRALTDELPKLDIKCN